MTRLGRFDVWIITRISGEQVRKDLDERTIYTDAQGVPHMRWHREFVPVEATSVAGTYRHFHDIKPMRVLVGADLKNSFTHHDETAV